jgi:molybdopterin biosynthesis enzyme
MLVRRRPRIAIPPTGSEIRPVGTTLAPGEILDTNSVILAGLVEDAGCMADALPIDIAGTWPHWRTARNARGPHSGVR